MKRNVTGQGTKLTEAEIQAMNEEQRKREEAKTADVKLFGVCIGTCHKTDDEDKTLWFGFVPNETGLEVLPENVIDLLDMACHVVTNGMHWSLRLDLERGLIYGAIDSEEIEDLLEVAPFDLQKFIQHWNRPSLNIDDFGLEDFEGDEGDE
jgi:hypothetical protein